MAYKFLGRSNGLLLLSVSSKSRTDVDTMRKEPCVLIIVLKKHTSIEHLRHVKGFEHFVFELGF